MKVWAEDHKSGSIAHLEVNSLPVVEAEVLPGEQTYGLLRQDGAAAPAAEVRRWPVALAGTESAFWS